MFAITGLRFNEVVLGPSEQLRGASDLEFSHNASTVSFDRLDRHT